MTASSLSEKYRPKCLSECVLLPMDRATLEAFVAKGHAPHILLGGPPGAGKTSVAMALVNEFGWQALRKNAAAYASIDSVRTEIATFALPQTMLYFLAEGERHHCVFLDEAEHMPAMAQAALRGVMEEAEQTGHATFILTANDINRIDPAVCSRCAAFDFSHPDPIDREAILDGFRKRMSWIVEHEGYKPDQKVIGRLIDTFGLDFRRALNELEKYLR